MVALAEAVLPLTRKLGIKLIDLVILAFMLIIVTSTTIQERELLLLPLDFWNIFLIVTISYMAIVTFVKILTYSMPDNNIAFRLFKTAVAGMLVYYMFPHLLGILMWFLGYRISAPMQILLGAVALVRTILSACLSRYWTVIP